MKKSLQKSSLRSLLATLGGLFMIWTISPAHVEAQTTNTFPASGNVGVGTTTPGSLLEINKSQSAGTTVVIDNSHTTASNAAYSGLFFKQAGANRFFLGSINDGNTTQFLSGGAGSLWLWNYANGPMLFATNNAERMRIDAAGSVGIGTTTPTERLTVVAQDATSNGVTHVLSVAHTTTGTPATGLGAGILFRAKRSDGSMGFIGHLAGIWEDPTTGTEDGALLFAPVLNSSGYGTERMRITSSGVVGIGTTTPSTAYKLDVNGEINATGFRINGTPITTGGGSQWTTFPSTSNIYYNTGNVGIGSTGPTEKLQVVGNIKLTGTGNIDASGTITATNIVAKYQDVAEWVESSQILNAGTVVVLDHTRSNQVVASSRAYDTRVAGVISLQPGIALGESGATKVLVATTGRVKIKVDASAGPIQIGDLLVTSDKEGVAKKSDPLMLGGVQIHRPGTLIGKALEPLATGTGEILVLLSLQ